MHGKTSGCSARSVVHSPEPVILFANSFLVSQDWRINSTVVPCIVVARVEPGSGNRHDSVIAGLILLFSQAPSALLVVILAHWLAQLVRTACFLFSFACG